MLFSICLLLPVGLAVNIIESEWVEVKIISSFMSVAIVCYILNIRGANQVSFIILSSFVIITAVIASQITETQSAAPYGTLSTTVTSIFIFKKRLLKFGFAAASILVFAITNYYQLKNNTFDSSEYVAIVFILILVFGGLLYIENEAVGYQRELEKKNVLLTEQQETIVSQSETVISLKAESHQREMKLKQKDMEMVMANAFARDKMTENLSDQLKGVLKRGNIESDLKKVIHELGFQNELINKLDQIRQNLDEINAEFYERLLKEYPEISKAERALCAHLKLGLSNKEIAQIKNSTENSVNVSKARLRKKIGLETNKELQQLLLNF